MRPESELTPGPWKYDPDKCAIVSTTVYFVEPDDDANDEGILQSIVDLTGAFGGTRADLNCMVAAPDILAALKRLALAAAARENTQGDPMRLLEVQAELREAATAARAIIAETEGAKDHEN